MLKQKGCAMALGALMTCACCVTRLISKADLREMRVAWPGKPLP